MSQVSSSRDIARDRLSKVLMHDRACFSPELLETLRTGLIREVREYADIDESLTTIHLEQQGTSSKLIISIPVLTVYRLEHPEETVDVF